MGVPGPGAAEWGLALLVFAALAAIVGEFVRGLGSRYVATWRRLDLIERFVLDFYLGGALLYLIAAVPWGAFIAPVVFVIPILAAIGLVVLAFRVRRTADGRVALGSSLVRLGQPLYWIVIASSLGLFAFEVALAAPVGTGNTFDSSLLTTYTSLLLQNHQAATTFAPYATTGLLYPQGTTVWLGWAEVVFGLPAARTALLVTPLFLGIAPLAGFAFGRRMFGSDRAGLAVALLLACIGTGTRSIVYGSNDFVLAFPLVLLLAGQATLWLRGEPPRLLDAVGFGVLVGYSAALNPVGAQWLLLGLPIAGLLTRPMFQGAPRRWFVRWGAMALSSLIGVIPSLYVLLRGYASPGFVPGATAAPPGSPTGISQPQFFGFIDPFLFGSSSTELSSVPALRFELVLLLVVGLAIVFLASRDSALGRYLEPFRPFVAGAAAAIVLLLGVVLVAGAGYAPAVAFSHITSASELSVWIFALYGFVAAIPLALALERFAGWVRRSTPTAPGTPPSAGPGPAARSRPSVLRAIAPIVVALAIVVPGVVLTPTELSTSLSGTYSDFGNVTAADFDLLDYAGVHLPSGARVLVAPGSAGEFLPGYCSNIVLLFPMVPGFRTINASYELLVQALPNGTLGPPELQALSALDVNYVVVTGANTVLWRPFSPAPFLAEPSAYRPVFEEGDAYLFEIEA